MAGGFVLVYYKVSFLSSLSQSKGSRYPIGTRALKSGVLGSDGDLEPLSKTN